MSTVVDLKSSNDAKAAQAERRSAAIRAFNALYARWLRARANVVRPHGDDDVDADQQKLDALTDEITTTPAVIRYHVRWKFEVLLNELLCPDMAMPEGTRELVQSIQRDVEDLLSYRVLS
jgi:hypothetical protein